jgi:3-methyladenine DNA glycosylase/8-oxoguanine DNA glycosylase
VNVFRFDLTVEEPFDFGLTVRKPAGWHWSTPFEVFEKETLHTTLRLSNFKLIGLKMRLKDERVKTEAFSSRRLSSAEKGELLERVKLGLGVEDDIEGFYSLAESDNLVRMLKDDLYGMRLGFPNDVFERALLAICLQMAPMKRSNQMMECLIKCYGDKIRFSGREILHWPSPTRIANTTVDDLRKKCNVGYRAESIKKVAEAIVRGFPSILELKKLS